MSDTILSVLITSLTTIITTLIGAFVKARSESLPAPKNRGKSRETILTRKAFRLSWQIILIAAALVGLITFGIVFGIGKIPKVVVITEDLTGWATNFTSSNGNAVLNAISLAPGRKNNGIQLSYDLGESGYDIITKNIKSKVLSETKGITFYHKGSGAANSIEFKLMLRYPGETEDTTYGLILPGKTDTGAEWVYEEISYSDLNCWWPAALCEIHGNAPDLSAVVRMDFAVSNKLELNDEAGSGWVIFDEVMTIE